jgi:2-C-methyl-D-erythritol 2,4-cyclodiphosphate synthase
LGGVSIPHNRHLLGHSDADVLLHAVTDALLGGAALGDIGELYPDTDPANQNRNSGEMLQAAYRQVQQSGYRIVNLDTIVFAERPRLGPYKQAIRQQIGELLAITPEQVGLKAKTGEGVGVIGESLAISAECVALLEEVGTGK